jgi:hypothetical protein
VRECVRVHGCGRVKGFGEGCAAGAGEGQQWAAAFPDKRGSDGETIDIELGRVGVHEALGGRVVHDPAVGGGGVADEAAFCGPIFERTDLAFVVGEVGVHVAPEGTQDGEVR